MIRAFLLACTLVAAPAALAQDGPGGCDSRGYCYNGARLNPGAADRDRRDNRGGNGNYRDHRDNYSRDNRGGYYGDRGGQNYYQYDNWYGNGWQYDRRHQPNYSYGYPPQPPPGYYQPYPQTQYRSYSYYAPRNYCMRDNWGRMYGCRRVDSEDAALALITLGFILLVQ